MAINSGSTVGIRVLPPLSVATGGTITMGPKRSSLVARAANRSDPVNVLTEGEVIWDATTGDFNWAKTDALPESLQSKFKNEPLYVDLRWAKTAENLSLRHSQFRPAILDIAAPLLRRPKDELDGEDVQQHRRFRTITRLVIVALILLTLLLTSGISGLIAQIRETGKKTSQLGRGFW
jgi:hypothetical protein